METAATADAEEERLFLTAGITERESAKELARLRHSGPLDRLLGVDKFWTEKVLLFVLWLQDFALIWMFPSMMWPWHFWGKSHIVMWSLLDFHTRRTQMKSCDSCSPWPDCSPSGCAPTLDVFGAGAPSDITNSIIISCGVAFFLSWLFINNAPDMGLISPALARNLERVLYPWVLFFYTPFSLRALYVFCDYDTFVIENWKCTPNIMSVPWFFVSCIYSLGLPYVIVKRVARQQLFRSGLRHETYMRTRELEYKLGLSTAYRDKKLWIMSSFTGFGCYSGAWFAIQKIIIILLTYLCTTGLRTSDSFRYFAAGAVAVLFGIQSLFLIFVVRAYRVITSHWTHTLFVVASAFNAWIGFLQATGARLLSDKDLRVLLSAFNLSIVSVFFISLLITFILVHDFIPQRGTATNREVSKFKKVVSKVRVSEENLMHMHLGKSLKILILYRWKNKVLQTRRQTANNVGVPKVGNKKVTMRMEIQYYEEEDFCSDLALFGGLMISVDDIAVTVVSSNEDTNTTVLDVRIQRLLDNNLITEFINRCNQPGDLMKESLNVISVELVPYDVVTVSIPLSVVRTHFNTMFIFSTSSDGKSISRINKTVNDYEELSILNEYVHKTVLTVNGIQRDSQEELHEIIQCNDYGDDDEIILAFDKGEVPDDVFDQNDFLQETPETAPTSFPQRKGSTNYELSILQALLSRSDELTDAELFSPVDSEEQIFKPVLSYFLKLNSNARYMWPVSQSLVTEIKRENETNHFLDILREANGILMEVSFMHETPELIRIESLLFHIRRVTRCLKACTELRVAHHLNAIHPLAPTFESVLDELVYEFRSNKGKSLAIGRRASKLPIVSAFLHHRMNERQHIFILVKPIMLKVLFKLLVLRMFIELVGGKKELLPEVRPSPTVEIDHRSFPDTFEKTDRRTHSETRGSRVGFQELSSHQSVFTFISPIELEEDESLHRLQLANEETIKRKEITQGLQVWITRWKQEQLQHQAEQLKIQQTVFSEESFARSKILREEKMAWKAWVELSEDLMKNVREIIKHHKQHLIVFEAESASRTEVMNYQLSDHLIVQTQLDASMSRLLDNETEKQKLLEMQAAMKARKEQQTANELERKQQSKLKRLGLVKLLNSWKEKYKKEHGQYPTKKVLASTPDISDVYNEYLSIPKDGSPAPVEPLSVSSSQITPSPLPTPLIGVQLSPDKEPGLLGNTPPEKLPQKERDPVKTRKAELVKILNAWKLRYVLFTSDCFYQFFFFFSTKLFFPPSKTKQSTTAILRNTAGKLLKKY